MPNPHLADPSPDLTRRALFGALGSGAVVATAAAATLGNRHTSASTAAQAVVPGGATDGVELHYDYDIERDGWTVVGWKYLAEVRYGLGTFVSTFADVEPAMNFIRDQLHKPSTHYKVALGAGVRFEEMSTSNRRSHI